MHSGERICEELVRDIESLEKRIERKLDKGNLTSHDFEILRLRGDQIARKTKFLEVVLTELRNEA
jgi:hypothetical protein